MTAANVSRFTLHDRLAISYMRKIDYPDRQAMNWIVQSPRGPRLVALLSERPESDRS
jgi:hypothetical protein